MDAEEIVQEAVDRMVLERSVSGPDWGGTAIETLVRICAEDAAKYAIRLTAERYERLHERIESIVPYIVATLPKDCDGHDAIWEKATGKEVGDWSACHRGRAYSSVNQLRNLLNESHAIRAEFGIDEEG